MCVVEPLEQVLAWTLCVEFQAEPGKAIPSVRGSLRHNSQVLREGTLAVVNTNLRERRLHIRFYERGRDNNQGASHWVRGMRKILTS